MKPLTVHEIRQAVHGRALCAIPVDAPLVRSVCTDTRNMQAASLFVAIGGARFDGHNFLPEAARNGAVAALVEKPPPYPLPNLQIVQVPSTRAALGRLAMHVRRQFTCKVIAVAGSNGKTTTKYLIDCVLRSRFRGTFSPKSFNNDIGVPLAIFLADPQRDYLVLEIGTNHPGEVQALSEMCQPDIAVITNVAAEHLEGLGDIDGVCREEASIIKGLNPRGTLVVNGDDPGLLELVGAFPGQRITFGLDSRNELFATNIRIDSTGIRFRLNSSRREVFLPMLGKHNACNALAALAVARKMGIAEEAIIDSLASAHGPEMRLQLQKLNGVTLLNDAYNANPASMRAALETVSELPSRGRRVAVVGEMRELGAHTERYHREAGQLATRCKLDVLICIGDSAKLIADAAIKAGMPRSAIKQVRDVSAATRLVPRMLRRGDLVLLKGSRSLELENLVSALAERKGAVKRKSA